jgi:NAD(P)H-flavin reductase
MAVGSFIFVTSFLRQKSFLVQQFLENAAEGQGARSPLSLSADREISCAIRFAHGEKGEKSDRISRENEQDRSPFLDVPEHQSLENVPVEHFQR